MPYANAPLVLVALEVRYPSENSVAPPTVEDQRDLRARLDALEGSGGQRWVVDQLRPAAPALQLAIGPGGPVQQGGFASLGAGLPRLMNRERTMAVTFGPMSLIVETTDYHSWAEFKTLVEPLVNFVADRMQPDGYSRLGIRYLDEVQIPLEESPVDWSKYLSSTLPPLPPEGFSAQSWQSVVQYTAEGDKGLILRYGPLDNPIMNPGNGLQRRPMGEGALFVIDTDAFVQPQTIPVFDPATIMDLLDGLHVPVSTLFESLVTMTLRKLWE